MKSRYILIFLIFVSNICSSQISFKIDTLIISDFVEPKPHADGSWSYTERMGAGPEIKTICSITNNSNDTIILNTVFADVFFVFNYEGIKYEVTMGLKSDYFPIPPPIFKETSVKLLPQQSFTFSFRKDYLFSALGVEWFRNKTEAQNNMITEYDFIKEVIETLPTFKVRYKEAKLDLTTDEIKNVIVIW
ncbi:MAG: hypothetical protein LBL74_06205 [Bacteroidales bacterium]|jgi:hypothetical protein|nr:hypothetical protein [Bacteroidales bacterium]